VGDSVFLANGSIDNVANHDFASHGINWLLARNELLLGLAPRPIKEYKLALTQSKLRAVSWILLAGMPGSVLLLGGVVWFRRRK
jgi:LPXTG-motif cell wall-anchored protein